MKRIFLINIILLIFHSCFISAQVAGNKTSAGGNVILSYNDLKTNAFTWNSFPGNVHGFTLDTVQPAIALYSYKFFLAQAISFELWADGEKCKMTGSDITWSPHEVEGLYSYAEGELTLTAFFVAEEVISIQYSVKVYTDKELEIRVNGISRNGQDEGRFFKFQGEPKIINGLALVNQEIEIPDYHRNQIGELRRFTHYLSWMVGINSPIELLSEETVTEDPFYFGKFNKSDAWSARQQIIPNSTGERTQVLYIAMRWLGNDSIDVRDIYELQTQIGQTRNKDFQETERQRRLFYEDILQKLPPVKEQYFGNREYLKLYAQAWMCIWQNVTGSLVTARKTLSSPGAFVSKVAKNGFGPAQWETSLAGYLLSFMDVDLGVGILESVLSSVEDDGFIPEDLIFNRDVKLSSLEPYMLEEISLRTNRVDFLGENYEAMYRQLLFHIKHPGFQYLTAGSYHLAMDNYYSLLSLERIARKQGKPHEHLRKLKLLKEDMQKFLDNDFKKYSRNEPVFEYLHDYLTSEEAKLVLERLNKHHLPSDDHYFMYLYPDGFDTRRESENLNSYKMVFFLHFILGMEKFGEQKFLDSLTEKTFQGLQKAGGFWECYYVTGQPWGNGPMSIFGAFGWIWLMMEKSIY